MKFRDFTNLKTTGQLIPAEVLAHPEYNPDTWEHDIALLRLSQQVPKSSAISICPADVSFENHSIVVSGMGRQCMTRSDPECNYPETLKEIRVHEVPWNVTNEIRLEGDSRDACAGDSGGPATPLVDEKPFCLLGIVRDGSKKCDGQGTYMRVPEYKNWIDKLMEPESRYEKLMSSVERLIQKIDQLLIVFGFSNDGSYFISP